MKPKLYDPLGRQLIVLCLSLATLSSVTAFTQTQQKTNSFTTDKTKLQKEQRLRELMSLADIPGLSVAVIKDGRIQWTSALGVTNADSKVPVTADTVFEAASLSKPVFAYAVLKLVDEGKLSLDTPLVKYLPGRYDVGDDPRLDKITARHVLSHTTGFPNWRPRGSTSLQINFTPGERFSYSGEGFVYLSRVVAHITNESLEALIQHTVFNPLGMKSSSYVWREDYEQRKTYAHNSVGAVTGRSKPDSFNAAASLHTTAYDYALFVCEMFKQSTKSESAFSQMFQPQVSVPGNRSVPASPASTSISWGLGWGLEKEGSVTSFWHWGDNGNAKAFVIASAATKSGVVMFANSANGLAMLRELLTETVGGSHSVVSWINYERYDSTARKLLKAILASDAETVLKTYRQQRSDKVSDVTKESTNGSANQSERLTETQMNALGYQLLSLKRVKDAIAVFIQNTVDFPDAFNTWDSLAEAYMIDGNKDLAIKYYKKSLELNQSNTNAAEKLKELGTSASSAPKNQD